jgi:hypothetical protein
LSHSIYTEHFDHGPGGWFAWISNSEGPKPLEYQPGVVTSRSPWWVDYNHAPPGAGYLHMLFTMFTKGPLGEYYKEVGGENHFIQGGFSRDFTNARVTVRLKGELEAKGAEVLLLVQASANSLTSGWLLTGQPLQVTPDWSEQTIAATSDPSQWKCLGGRHDRQDYYGEVELETVLSDVNCDILFVLFPLNVLPMGQIDGNPHILRPEKDYPVWRSRLPEGYVMLDEVRIEFPGGSMEGGE